MRVVRCHVTYIALLILIGGIVKELGPIWLDSLWRILVLLHLLQSVLLAYQHAIADIVGHHLLIERMIFPIRGLWSLNTIVVDDDQACKIAVAAWIIFTITVTDCRRHCRVLKCALAALTIFATCMSVLRVGRLLLLLIRFFTWLSPLSGNQALRLY